MFYFAFGIKIKEGAVIERVCTGHGDYCFYDG